MPPNHPTPLHGRLQTPMVPASREAGRERRRTRGVGEVVRLVERLRAARRPADVIERMVGAFMRELGRGPSEVADVVRELGLGRGRLGVGALVARVDAWARRPGAGPEQSEPQPTPTPLWRLRDARWFSRLQASALASRSALRQIGWPAPPAAPIMAPVRTFDTVVRAVDTFGARVDAPRTYIAPTMPPGVFALQLASSDRLAAGVNPSVADILARLGPGRPVPEPARRWVAAELARQGRAVELEHVRLHEGAEADALCRQLRAQAFALGRHVVFRSGLFRADDARTYPLLVHELTHVWQQARGQVSTRGLAEDPALESEARAAEAAATARPVAPASDEAPRAAAPAVAAPRAVGQSVLPCDDASDESRREAGSQPSEVPRAAGQPRPRAVSARDLMREARAFLAATRMRPIVTFLVTDRIDAFDVTLRAVGSWRITGDVPLGPGFYFDGGVDVAAWSDLTPAVIANLCRGRADDLWVVGGRAGARMQEGAAAS